MVKLVAPDGYAVMFSLTGCLRGAGLFVLSSALFVLTVDDAALQKNKLSCMKRNFLPFLVVSAVVTSLGVIYFPR